MLGAEESHLVQIRKKNRRALRRAQVIEDLKSIESFAPLDPWLCASFCDSEGGHCTHL